MAAFAQVELRRRTAVAASDTRHFRNAHMVWNITPLAGACAQRETKLAYLSEGYL